MSIWFFVVVGGLLVIALVLLDRLNPNKKEAPVIDDPDKVRAARLQSRQSKVVSKEADMGFQSGVPVPYFEITFETDKGKMIVLDVPEYLYDRFVVGDENTLITQNGEFIGFGDIGAEESES